MGLIGKAQQFHAFYLDGNGDFSFEDMTIRGPSDPGTNSPDNTLTYSIYADALEVGNLSLNRVKVDGHFYCAVQGNKNAPSGPWYWTLTNCDITAARGRLVSFFQVCTMVDLDVSEKNKYPSFV